MKLTLTLALLPFLMAPSCGDRDQPIAPAGAQASSPVTGAWEGGWRSFGLIGTSGSCELELVANGSAVSGTATFNGGACSDGGDYAVSGSFQDFVLRLTIYSAPPRTVVAPMTFPGQLDGEYRVEAQTFPCAFDWGRLRLRRK